MCLPVAIVQGISYIKKTLYPSQENNNYWLMASRLDDRSPKKGLAARAHSLLLLDVTLNLYTV